VQIGLFCLCAALSGGTRESTVYHDYKEAWTAARAEGVPLLVIINPGPGQGAAPVDLAVVNGSRHRRELLSKYVVAVIDASTDQGERVHRLFKSPQLPRVSVIDRQQKWQIYRTSAALSPEDWNLVLEGFQTGVAPPPPAPTGCAACRGMRF
jgi:hypothetical protein